MPFDFKKEYKEIYMPKKKPEIVTVPKANYIAVRGKGDPNEEGGEYKVSIGLLYTIAFTLKMSKRTGHEIEGYYDYVVPPLEGFWWQEGTKEIDFSRKEDFCWISVIRLPDFIKKEDFEWALKEAEHKKKTDFSKVEFLAIEEGLCVQIMHIGAYDDEPESVALMDEYLVKEGYENDFSEIQPEYEKNKLELGNVRLHHEIYLSDARKVESARRKTVIRHPVKVREADRCDSCTAMQNGD